MQSYTSYRYNSTGLSLPVISLYQSYGEGKMCVEKIAAFHLHLDDGGSMANTSFSFLLYGKKAHEGSVLSSSGRRHSITDTRSIRNVKEKEGENEEPGGFGHSSCPPYWMSNLFRLPRDGS